MAIIPEQRLHVERDIEDREIWQTPRTYIGYSGIGNHCKRYVHLNFRWAFSAKHPARVQRLFERGEYEEEVVVKDLERIGCKVKNRQTELIGTAGHIFGHIDGEVENVPDAPKTEHLLEVKTCNAKNFALIKKLGLQEFSSAYWWQQHIYMGKRDLKRCLYVITNKDTEERIYLRIHFDKSIYDLAMRAEVDILTAERLFPRIGNNDETWFECKYCNANRMCFGKVKPNENCRTCKHVNIEDGMYDPNDPSLGGKWTCSARNDRLLSPKEQWDGCNLYIMDELFTC